MILIDTNVLYYASKAESENEQYSKVLDNYIKQNKNKVSLLSVSCYEYFCKYHNKVEELEKIKAYIKENSIEIINDDYYILQPLFKGNDYDKIFENCLKVRVPIEVAFLNNVINCLLSSVIFSLAVEYGVGSDVEIVPIIVNEIKICDTVNKKLLPDMVEKNYQNNVGKDAMWDALQRLINTYIGYIFPVMNEIFSLIAGKSEVLYKKKKYSFSNVDSKGTSKFLHNVVCNIKNCGKDKYLKIVNEIIEKNIDPRDTISKKRLAYIVEKTLTNGNKIDKNDIVDGRLLSYINNKNDILLSVDSDINRYMRKNNDNGIYGKSLQEIESIKL